MFFSYTNSNLNHVAMPGSVFRPSVYSNTPYPYNPYFRENCSNSTVLFPFDNSAARTIVSVRQPIPLITNESMSVDSSILPCSSGSIENSVNPVCLNLTERKNCNNLTKLPQENKNKISELNPCASEFSSGSNSLKSSNDSIENNKDQSSYRLIFNELIDKSLQSIEAIKNASKTYPMVDASTQYQVLNEKMHRSAQTGDDYHDEFPLQQYSEHSIQLIDRVFNTITRIAFDKNHSPDYSSLLETCEELRQLMNFINEIVISKRSTSNKISGFNRTRHVQALPSPLIFERNNAISRLIPSSIKNRDVSLQNSNKIDHKQPIAQSKFCLLCRKPLMINEIEMHSLCRLISSPDDSLISKDHN